jgi:hypothetical protein
MKKSLLVSGLCISVALISQPALAEVKFRAGAGSSTYKLSGDYITAASTFNMSSVGVTFSSNAASGAGYLDVSYAGGSGQHDGWSGLGYPNEDFKRSDWAVTGGVVFLNQNSGVAGNIYVGLKGGSTTLGAQGPHSVSSLAWSEEKFDSAGVVFGGGASFPIASGRAGFVGVNAGLGVMSATWKDDNGFDAKSSTAVGGSIGANYTFPFSRNFGVVADYKLQAYSYNFGDTSTPFTVDEKFSTLMAYLYAKF